MSPKRLGSAESVSVASEGTSETSSDEGVAETNTNTNKRRVHFEAQIEMTNFDSLYHLYTQGLLLRPHQFERQIGPLRSLIYTNTPIELAHLVVVFFHGLGASPWHFVRVAHSFLDNMGRKIADVGGLNECRVAFIFPFAPHKMKDEEFGAVSDCIYGSYKWWDIFNEQSIPIDEEKTALSPAQQSSAYGLPTIIRNAVPSPRRINTRDHWPEELEAQTSNVIVDDEDEESQSLRKDSTDSDSDVDATLPASAILGVSKRLPSPSANLSPRHTMLESRKSPFLRTSSGVMSNDSKVTVEHVILQEKTVPWWRCCTRAAVADAKKHDVEEKSALENPQGRADACAKILEFLDVLQTKWQLPMSKIAVAGFSQGAMLAVDVLHELKSPPAFATVFSGAPMCADLWAQKVTTRTVKQNAEFAQMPLLQAHGMHDWIIPIFAGRWLNRFLVRNAWRVRYLEFTGDHELPDGVTQDFHKLVFAYATREYYEKIQAGEIPRPSPMTRADGDSDEFRTPLDEIDEDYGRPCVFNNGGAWAMWDRFAYSIAYAFAACVLPCAKRVLN